MAARAGTGPTESEDAKMTELLFREDAYRREAETRVTALTEEGGIICDAALFYPTGGGQPGDSGTLEWSGGRLEIATAVKGPGGAVKGRLDFAMPEPPEDKTAVEDALNALIARDLAVTERWITEAELDANPALVKTMSVQPPRGAGRIRLVRIGTEDDQVDLQPCGGTHVARTGEIGRVTLGKIENKGKQNRRVHIALAE